VLVVEVVRGPQGEIRALKARGHAGFSQRGSDIVCAGASAVLHAAALGVVKAAGLPAQVRAGEGHMEIELDCVEQGSSRDWDRGQAILEAAVLGVTAIAQQYPQHVRVRERPPEKPGRVQAGAVPGHERGRRL